MSTILKSQKTPCFYILSNGIRGAIRQARISQAGRLAHVFQLAAKAFFERTIRRDWSDFGGSEGQVMHGIHAKDIEEDAQLYYKYVCMHVCTSFL